MKRTTLIAAVAMMAATTNARAEETVITTTEIIVMTETRDMVRIGASLPTSLSLMSDEYYTVEGIGDLTIAWEKAGGADDTFAPVAEGAKAEAESTYRCTITVSASENYAFDTDGTYYIVVNEIDDAYSLTAATAKMLTFSATRQTRKALERIDVGAPLPSAKGDALMTKWSAALKPEGETAETSMNCYYVTGAHYIAMSNAKAEAGDYCYTVDLRLTTASEYDIAATTAVTFNGETITPSAYDDMEVGVGEGKEPVKATFGLGHPMTIMAYVRVSDETGLKRVETSEKGVKYDLRGARVGHTGKGPVVRDGRLVVER